MKPYFTTIFLLIFGLSSCGGEINSNQSDVGSDDKQTEEIIIMNDPCEITDLRDISDSLVILYDEILKKKCDFNKAKFDVNLERWQGCHINLSGLTVESIYVEGEDNMNYIVLKYGETFQCSFFPNSINIFANFKTKAEMAQFEVGEQVNLSAIIKNGSASKFAYSLHLTCEKVTK